MGGAIGLFCVSSEAVLASTVRPNVPDANIGEAKPPFTIPKSGNFKYNGRSPFGDVLVMAVTWKVSGLNKKTGTTRISGDVKYKNPKTNMMDSLVIDENRSFIKNTGELFFALHAVGDKVYGPVDLVALDGAHGIKFNSPPKKNPPPSDGEDTSPKNGLSMNPDPASASPIDEEVAENPADANVGALKLAADKNAASPPGIVINDVFQTKGEFSPASRRMTIKWKQANFIKRLTYPAGSKAISFEIYLDGKLQAGWKRNGPVYLDKDGFAYVPVVSPKGIPHNYKSKVSFHSQGFKTLVKAVDTLKKESAHIRKKGLKSLPGARKNKKGEIISTDGALILGAVIKLVGPQKIAHKKSGLAVRTFDNIQWRLKDKETGWIVHRIVKHAGLKVDHHPTRGRSLVQGETSAAGAARGQYITIDDIVANRPAPVWQEDLVNEILQGRRTLNPTRDHVNLGQTLVESGLYAEQERANYARDLTTYFRNQRALFPNGLANDTAANFQRSMTNLLRITQEVRRLTGTNPITISQYNGFSRNFTNILAALHKSGRLAIEPDEFRNMLARIPGFQPDREQLRNIMRSEIQTILDNWRITDQLSNEYALPFDVARAILLLVIMLSPLGI